MTRLLRGGNLASAEYPGLTDALAHEQPGKNLSIDAMFVSTVHKGRRRLYDSLPLHVAADVARLSEGLLPVIL